MDLQPATPSYREIALTQGKVAIVDPDDYEALSKFKWYAYWDPHPQTYRARRNIRDLNGKRQTVLMHRQILNSPTGIEVDHRDGDGLNNRRDNLRSATSSQNAQNQKAKSNNRSGLKGIWKLPDGRWKAKVVCGGISHYLGIFFTPEDAHAAYIEAAKRLHGEFAN
jgi:HNH endonuclease/AP2 domain